MLNDYRQIITALRNSTWLILPESLDTILDIVNMRLSGTAFSDEEIRIRLQEAESENRQNSRIETGGGIGIIPLYGPIFPKANLMTELSGATSLENFRKDLDMLMNDSSVEKIVMDVDSPGGVSDMVVETSQIIREARETKPIYAVANTMAGSAAYMLASQATEFYATPTGKVGSLGTYVVHEDISRKNEAEGRKFTYISSGSKKTAGNEHEPLDEEARAYIQELVDDAQSMFVEQVALGRNKDTSYVTENFGQGGIVPLKKAQEVGMIDGIQSLESVVGSLLVESQPQVQGTLAGMMVKHNKALKVAQESGITIHNTVTPTLNKSKEGRMNEAELRQALGLEEGGDISAAVTQLMSERQSIRQTLGLGDDANVAEAVTALNEEIAPVRAAQANASKTAQFAEQFPEEFARMQRLEAKDIKADAIAFADRYERFTKQDGDKTVKSHVGFPMVTLNKIAECHEAVSKRGFSHELLEDLLGLVTQQGFVDFSEKGSKRAAEGSLHDDPIKQFNSRVLTIMTEDKKKAGEATRMAIAQFPEEYEAYVVAQRAKSVPST